MYTVAALWGAEGVRASAPRGRFHLSFARDCFWLIIPFAGPDARFAREEDVYRQIRERYLLFVNCIESKPGDEPKHPFLYPLAGAAASAPAAKH